MIQENFIHIDKVDTFNELKEQIPNNSLTFINESGTIYHKGEEFLNTRWDEIGYPLSHIIHYTTNDGNIINVHNYWLDKGYKPIINKYDKEKDKGVIMFENPITEIPGIGGQPFLYNQKNLLTLKLPTSVKSFGRGCFYDCTNLYYVNVEDLALEELGYGVFGHTGIKSLDFSKSVFTYLREAFIMDNPNHIIDTIILPTTLTDFGVNCFNQTWKCETKINNLVTPTLSNSLTYIEETILKNVIITKTDGIARLHHFKTDCIIWVPDEWYDTYIEHYTNNTDYSNWQDIVNRLKPYSEGVPQFPIN